MTDRLTRRFLGAPLWFWGALLLPRLALFLAVAVRPGFCLSPDALGYLELARNLSEHFSFSTGVFPALSPDTFRTPGYPLFLAALGLLPGDPTLVAAAANLLLSALACLLAWRWFEKLAGAPGAAVGALFFALDYVWLMHSPLLLAEALMMPLLLLASAATLEAWRKGSVPAALGAGLLWAAAGFVKPVSLFLPLVPAAALFFRNRAAACLFLAAVVLPPAAWVARNRALTGYTVYSTISGITWLRYPAAELTARKTGRSWAECDAELRARVDARFPGGYANSAQKGAAYGEAGVKIVKEEPAMFAAYLARGAVKTALGTGMEMLADLLGLSRGEGGPQGGAGSGTRNLLRANPWLWGPQLLYMVFLGGLYFLAGAGALALWRSGRRAECAFLVYAALYFFLMASTQGYYRYRLPALPFLCALAAAGFRPAGPQGR